MLKSSEVMDYIRSKAPFKIVDQSKVNEIIYEWNVKLVQHVILHNIQCKINTHGIRPTINEMIVELTALGRNGQKKTWLNQMFGLWSSSVLLYANKGPCEISLYFKQNGRRECW